MTRETIEIAATDGSGTFAALVVKPDAGPTGAVVLIQEIFGVNDALRATADEVAAMGFIAVAPDLFWRQEPGVDLTDKSDAEWQKAFALMNGFDQQKGVADIAATIAVARTLPGANGRVATMGYCLGGRLAVMAAIDTDADANISYYGVGLDGLIDRLGAIRAPLVMHIADEDEFFPAEGRQKVVAAVAGNTHIAAYTYPKANHAFARVGGIHYDARSAIIANGRSAEALVRTLG
jgi:carboxymethylenebutenolidase